MVYPKTHPTEFMKIKGVQLAGLITTLCFIYGWMGYPCV